MQSENRSNCLPMDLPSHGTHFEQVDMPTAAEAQIDRDKRVKHPRGDIPMSKKHTLHQSSHRIIEAPAKADNFQPT